MTENAEGHFDFPHLNDTRVGERVFFIHESTWDGHPTLRQTLKTAACCHYGLAEQSVLPGTADDHLGGEHWLRLFRSAREAFDAYIAFAQWRLKHNRFDKNRPGDQIAQKSIESNANALLRQPWKAVEQEARTRLEALLQQRDYRDIPVQSHLIGDTVTASDGSKKVLEAVQLCREFDKQNRRFKPPRLEYYDASGSQIDLRSAS